MKSKKANKIRNILTKKDARILRAHLRKATSVRVYKRALILNALNLGRTQASIVDMSVACERTVRSISKKYQTGGLDSALFDCQRPGRPRKFHKKQEERITAIACTKPPAGQARWTLEMIKEAAEKNRIVKKICKETVRILLASREIKPWRVKMWCIPKIDSEFIRCMEDVLKIYERPLDLREPVICIDEKPVQMLDSLRPEIFGKIIKQDYEYKRNGMANVFCGIEPLAGKHFLYVRKRKTMRDFAFFIRKIVRAYPKAKKIHLVMDNLSTHKEKALIKTFGTKEGKKIWSRVVPHYTPKHASWLNQAEIQIGMFNRGCIGKVRVSNIEALRSRTAAWTKNMNRKKIKIDWKFSRRKARVKFKYGTGKN